MREPLGPRPPPTRRERLPPPSPIAVNGAPACRPRLLVFNQYYWPGVEATAQLLSDLCGALADDFDVTVVTGRLREQPSQPGHQRHDGVEIIRVR